MKKHLLLIATLCMAMLSAHAQRNYTFSAVALNVDGMPQQVSVNNGLWSTPYNVNITGPQASGTAAIGQSIVRNGWDVIGLCEDFNYHSNLVGETGEYYTATDAAGTINTSRAQKSSSDGLGLLCIQGMTFEQTAKIVWNSYNGSTGSSIATDGADGLATKGFRRFTITIAEGIAVDAYVLHMDAADADADKTARKNQLSQLATYIKENKGTLPILIMGNTNCLYYQDGLEANFIDVINADADLTIHDAWVELMWGGKYPTTATTTGDYGMQKGETVNKVFYINNANSSLTIKANSYLHDNSLGALDHYPVAVGFTITDPNGEAPTYDGWTVEGGVIDETVGSSTEVLDGETATSGTTYFIKNVGTGKYIKRGAGWGTQAVEGSAGTPITLEGSGNTYTLKTLWGVIGAQTYPFTDQTGGTWTLEQVPGTSAQYYIKCAAGALSSTGYDASNGCHLKCVPHDTSDDYQKWVLLTPARMKTEMVAGTPANAFDITPLIYAADFDEGDDTGKWNGFSNGSFTLAGVDGSDDNDAEMATYNFAAASLSLNDLTLSQTITDLPAGNYRVSCQGYYRSRGKSSIIASKVDESLTATLTFGNGSGNIMQASTIPIPEGDAAEAAKAAAENFKGGKSYLTQFTTNESAGDKTLTISRTKNGYSSDRDAMFCVDNVVIEYLGTKTAEEIKAEVKKLVANHINRTALKVEQLHEKGQAAYDISIVLDRYHNDKLSADGKMEIGLIDAAYEVALIAHKQGVLDDALKDDGGEGEGGEGGGEVTLLITNPSFEEGKLTGWTTSTKATDIGVRANSGDYTTTVCDGNYLFNSYNSTDDTHTSYVAQEITNLENGLYELKAKLASFGTADGKTHDHTIYLTANGYHTGVVANGGKKVFQEATLYFFVEDGTATIGAVGGHKGAGEEFKHYFQHEGCFFKADDFRLSYVCDAAHGRIKMALNEAKAARLDAAGQDALNISEYQAIYDNKSLGDGENGVEEETAIYNALQAAAKAQTTEGADMTWAITNPSFEQGNYTGWTCSTGGDTKVALQEDKNFAVSGTDGRYLFNTYNGGTAQALTQTITGLPKGIYRLTAMVASDDGNSVNLTANGTTTTISTVGDDMGVFPSVKCEVTNDGTLSIEVVGVNNVWFKCDDFRLTYLGANDQITLDEIATFIEEIIETCPQITVKRTIKPNTWSSFVVPFDIPAENLKDWEIKELTGSTYDEEAERITLTFSDAEDGIKAGVPYMVRNKTMQESMTTITMTDVEVNTTVLKHQATDYVTFKGVYTNGYVPQGAFFISSNTFYQAADETNTLKGFRGYIEVSGNLVSNARALGYRFANREQDDDTTSIDNGQLTNDNEVTTVAIYNESGVRLSEMQQGLNILHMSDGSVVKILVK